MTYTVRKILLARVSQFSKRKVVLVVQSFAFGDSGSAKLLMVRVKTR